MIKVKVETGVLEVIELTPSFRFLSKEFLLRPFLGFSLKICREHA